MMTVLSVGCERLGGETAISYVRNGYQGACVVKESGNNENVIAVLPCLDEAISVACYSITADGGYGSVAVFSTSLATTHSSFMDWLS